MVPRLIPIEFLDLFPAADGAPARYFWPAKGGESPRRSEAGKSSIVFKVPRKFVGVFGEGDGCRVGFVND